MPNPNLAAALDAHRAALAACRACGLHAVHGSLPIVSLARRPRAMLVGQAPGATEREGGRSFAGPAGRTLFRWLERAGVSEGAFRRHVYIAAVTRCYPGPHPAGRGDRVPTPAERRRCRPWLDAELATIRPRLVIPVGRLAIDALLGPLPLDRVVGQAHGVTLAGGPATLVPLPHPSGASSWLNPAEHRALLDRALALLGAELAALGAADLRPAGAADAARVA
jgi:uracil-DNA glycosylase